MPHRHMTATEHLLNVPNMLAKQTPIWCTDLQEMVSIANIHRVFASIVNLTNNQASVFLVQNKSVKSILH